MKVTRFEDREPWLVARLGKATGSIAKELTGASRSEGVKPAIYRLAAESLIGSAALAEEENPMLRGLRLEPVAIARFEKETGKKVDAGLMLWERDDDSRIAVSPDGMIGKTAAIEIKCLSSAKHVEAMVTQYIPKNTAGYEEQALQYFVVNEKLTKLYYGFYDDRFPSPLDFFYLTFTRKEMQSQIDNLYLAECAAVAKVREIVNRISLYSPDDVAKINAVKEELLSSSDASV